MKILIALLFLANIVAYSAAGFPESISYQGILTDENGVIVADGEYTATFTLHGHSSASNELWSEEKTFSTEDGVFNVELGSDTPFTEENYEFGDQGIWLEIHLQGEDNPLEPRIKITLVPYAYNALRIDGGTIEDTPIGNTTPEAATFTTLEVTGNSIDASSATFSATSIDLSSSTMYIPNSVGDGAVLTSDGNGRATWQTPEGEFKFTTVHGSNVTLDSDNQYVIVETIHTVSLPSNPRTGQIIELVAETTGASLDPNGNTVNIFNNDYTTTTDFSDIIVDNFYIVIQEDFDAVMLHLVYNGTEWYCTSIDPDSEQD